MRCRRRGAIRALVDEDRVVLELVHDGRRLWQEASGWLRPGILYLTAPNADSINRPLLECDWSVVCLPEHLGAVLNEAMSRIPLRRSAKRVANAVRSAPRAGDRLKGWARRPDPGR